MAKAKNKFYVVWAGHQPGIYSSWNDCKIQINGYPEARYKGFETQIEAKKAYEAGPYELWGKNNKIVGSFKNELPDEIKLKFGNPIGNSICVDAACSGNPGKMEYQGVFTETGTELFKVGPFDYSTNNIGEFLAIVHALAYQKQNSLNLPIYSDSKIALGWVKSRKCRTKLQPNKKNIKSFELISRAEKWLSENKIEVPLLKWETKVWGEIPADFGRK